MRLTIVEGHYGVCISSHSKIVFCPLFPVNSKYSDDEKNLSNGTDVAGMANIRFIRIVSLG